MKLTELELTEAGFIFEREREFSHSEFEKETLNLSKLIHLPCYEIEE